MASTKVVLKHSTSGVLKEARLGFSWTTLIFCFWQAVFRGDMKWGVIQFFAQFLTFGASWLCFPFVYNKIFVKGLLKKGYIPADEGTANVLAEREIMVTIPGTTSVASLEQTPNATLKD